MRSRTIIACLCLIGLFVTDASPFVRDRNPHAFVLAGERIRFDANLQRHIRIAQLHLRKRISGSEIAVAKPRQAVIVRRRTTCAFGGRRCPLQQRRPTSPRPSAFSSPDRTRLSSSSRHARKHSDCGSSIAIVVRVLVAGGFSCRRAVMRLTWSASFACGARRLAPCGLSGRHLFVHGSRHSDRR